MKGSSKARKAPKVEIPPKNHPNVMREYDTPKIRKSPMLPMKQKRLSK
jgi:hypothetical protein